jgi:hypothetical protein
MTLHSDNLTLPQLLPVKCGVLEVPINFEHLEYFAELKTAFAQINHLLCLLDEKDIHRIVPDIDNRHRDSTLNIWTSKASVLAYAFKHNLINEFLTVISAVEDALDGDEICSDCVQGIAEEAACGEYELFQDEAGALTIRFQ